MGLAPFQIAERTRDCELLQSSTMEGSTRGRLREIGLSLPYDRDSIVEDWTGMIGLGPGRRQLLWFAVTRNPTAAWLARQITKAFPWDTAPKYLVRDNDRAFGDVFKARVRDGHP